MRRLRPTPLSPLPLPLPDSPPSPPFRDGQQSSGLLISTPESPPGSVPSRSGPLFVGPGARGPAARRRRNAAMSLLSRNARVGKKLRQARHNLRNVIKSRTLMEVDLEVEEHERRVNYLEKKLKKTEKKKDKVLSTMLYCSEDDYSLSDLYE